MNIHSKKGSKVRYTGKNGYDNDKEHANKYLEKGNIYTVYYTDVGYWSTDVYLEEVKGQCFNSVHFENLTAL